MASLQAFEGSELNRKTKKEAGSMKNNVVHLTALAAFAGIVLSATAGYANQGAGIGNKSMFERFDRNNDGQVTRAEAREAVAKRFARMDANNDGSVTRSERKAVRKNRRFQRMDLNGDGGVTLQEMQAATQQRVQRRFVRLDADGNGIVTQAEAQNARQKRNARRGPMTLPDLDARVMRMFDRADQNRDGLITSNEANLLRRDGQRN